MSSIQDGGNCRAQKHLRRTRDGAAALTFNALEHRPVIEAQAVRNIEDRFERLAVLKPVAAHESWCCGTFQ